MKTLSSRLVSVSILCLSVLSFAKGQEASLTVSPRKAYSVQTDKRRSAISRDEKLVRAAYEKLANYVRAYSIWRADRGLTVPAGSLSMLFELRDFRSGRIEEILDKRYEDLVTPPSGDIININHATHRENGGEEQAAYPAKWVSGQYSSIHDRQWTIADLMRLEPSRSHDVGSYTSYEVKVSFQGKVRTYRALVMYHDLYESHERRPDFWDTVVGMGGTLTQVWEEKRPPYKSSSGGSPRQATAIEWAPMVNSSTGHDLNAPFEISTTPTPLAGSVSKARLGVSDLEATTRGEPVGRSSVITLPNGNKLWIAEDIVDHASGSHTGTAEFKNTCTAVTSTQQRCEVSLGSVAAPDSGTVTNAFYYHVGRTDQKTEGSTGPRGSNVSCQSGAGAAFSYCLTSSCTFTVSVSLSAGVAGVNASVQGGNLWRAAHGEGLTCKIPKAASGGTVCMESYAPVEKSGSKNPSPMNANPSCCNTTERYECINGGGQWYETSCSCYSPIVIDVAGNGFNLTNAADGVLFDLARTGAPEQISWTSAGSDDAWLALDRNGNGTIDDGKELFGSATPQPYLSQGESKNGFRALAMFDSAEYGGNDDGQIDSKDSVFSSLKLWQDRNHNGFSEAEELQGLTESDISAIELSYRDSRQKDENGNWFRYRAKVRDARGARIGRWAWDVFVQKLN